MHADPTTMAFLHAHGLDVEPTKLEAALQAALDAFEVGYFPSATEALTVYEAEVAAAGGLDPTPVSGTTDPLVGGVVAYARILHTGLTSKGAAERLGVSDARVRQRIQERTLLGVRSGNAWRIPVFQFVPDGGELPGWGEVCTRIPVHASPVVVERWLGTPHPDLVIGDEEIPVSPRRWLAEGRAAAAVAGLADELA